MKNNSRFLILVLLFICGISCNKQNQKAPEKKVNITVTEYKTHAPVAGANVFLIQISLDIFNSSAITGEILSFQTDSNGICAVPETKFKDPTYAVKVMKDGFWTIQPDLFATSNATTYELQRENQIRLHLVQVNSYTDFLLFHLSIDGELPGNTLTPFIGYHMPADTTFLLDAFGGQTNHLNWLMRSQPGDSLAGGAISLDVLPTGTADLEIKY